MLRGVVAVIVLGAAGCGSTAEPPTAATTTVTSDTTTSSSAPLESPTLPPVIAQPVIISLRIERRAVDPSTEEFEAVVRSTLLDPRGWEQAGFAFRFDDPDAPYLVVLAEGAEVDALCLPYDTYGLYSCQNGPVVALNADRWRNATPEWTGDLDSYRQMLVNHEVGHLLGRHHPPSPQCPAPGRPALVMSQQSTELDGCLPNPWPLPEEITAAARHDEPLAPPYDG